MSLLPSLPLQILGSRCSPSFSGIKKLGNSQKHMKRSIIKDTQSKNNRNFTIFKKVCGREQSREQRRGGITFMVRVYYLLYFLQGVCCRRKMKDLLHQEHLCVSTFHSWMYSMLNSSMEGYEIKKKLTQLWCDCLSVSSLW